jgi:hypothetical protein
MADSIIKEVLTAHKEKVKLQLARIDMLDADLILQRERIKELEVILVSYRDAEEAKYNP